MNAARGSRRSTYAAASRRRATNSTQLPRPITATLRDSGETPASSAADGYNMHRVRVSKVEVLLNTNRSGGLATIDELESYLYDKLFKASALERLIPLPPHLQLRVDILAPAIEIGDRQKRVHAHYIMRIRHAGKLNLGALQPALQSHVRSQSSFTRAFVSVRLLSARPENYALKETFLRLPQTTHSNDDSD